MPKFDFNLKIFDVQDFVPETRNPPGTGAIGRFPHSDPHRYMLKVEKDRIDSHVLGNIDDISALESFTAQLIRAIWGPQFAADIHLAKISKSNLPLFLQIDADVTLKIDLPFCVASTWIENAKTLGFYQLTPTDLSKTLTADEEVHLTKIQTIARLLEIAEHKPNNLIYMGQLDSIIFIDCLAKLFYKHDLTRELCFTELFNPSVGSVNIGDRHFKKSVAIETVKELANFNDLDLILNQYRKILSEKTFNNIQIYFEKLQNACKEFLKQYELTQAGNLSIFANREKLPSENLSPAMLAKDILSLYEEILAKPPYSLSAVFTKHAEILQNLKTLTSINDDRAQLIAAIALIKGIPHVTTKPNSHYAYIELHKDLELSASIFKNLKSKGYEVEKLLNKLDDEGYKKEAESVLAILNQKEFKL